MIIINILNFAEDKWYNYSYILKDGFIIIYNKRKNELYNIRKNEFLNKLS